MLHFISVIHNELLRGFLSSSSAGKTYIYLAAGFDHASCLFENFIFFRLYDLTLFGFNNRF